MRTLSLSPEAVAEIAIRACLERASSRGSASRDALSAAEATACAAAIADAVVRELGLERPVLRHIRRKVEDARLVRNRAPVATEASA